MLLLLGSSPRLFQMHVQVIVVHKSASLTKCQYSPSLTTLTHPSTILPDQAVRHDDKRREEGDPL